MAFLDFPDTNIIKVMDTSEEIFVAGFKPDNNTELKYARILFFVKGVPGGSETLQLKVYSDTSTNNLLFSSNTINLVDVNPDPGNWYGFVRFDFTRQHLNSNNTYYFRLVATNYTRNADTFYMGAGYDLPTEIATNTKSGNFHPGKLEIFGYEE